MGTVINGFTCQTELGSLLRAPAHKWPSWHVVSLENKNVIMFDGVVRERFMAGLWPKT